MRALRAIPADRAVGGKLLLSGELDVGSILTTILAIVIGAFSIASIPESFSALNNAMAAASAIFDTIDRVPSIDSSTDEGLKPDKIEGELRLVDLRFRYPSRASTEVLRGVSCTFPAGKTTVSAWGLIAIAAGEFDTLPPAKFEPRSS